MRRGVCKSRAHRSRLGFSTASQESRPANKTLELPQGHGDCSPVGGGLVQDTTPSQPIQRPLCPESGSDSLAKRARPTQTDTQKRPPRRSARLRAKQDARASDPASSRPPGALWEWWIAGRAGKSTSDRPELTRRNTQLAADVGQIKAIETKQQPNPLQRPSTTPPEGRVGEQERAYPALRFRNRQIDGDGDADNNEHKLKHAKLTPENLAKFNKMAKKKETNKASVSAPPESTVAPSSIKTITTAASTTTSGFAIQAYENGILNPLSSRPPKNLEDIRKRYARSRQTASPTESVYEDYVDTVGGAPNESTMVVEVSGALLKKYDEKGYNRVFNQAFTDFPKDVGFNNSISAPQPDFVEGLRMQEYRPFPVHKHISGAVLYKNDPLSLTLPHMAGEWKGRGKDMEEARLQSAYDGAALVYARNKALSYLGKSDPPGYAEVTTFTTDGTNLNLFAHYAAPAADGTPEYHQYPIKSTNLVDSHQGLKDGRRGLRNEQDYARKQSYAMRDQLKERCEQRGGALQSVAQTAPLPVTNGTCSGAATVEAGYVAIEQPCQPTPEASESISPKPLPAVDDCLSRSSSQKRKASAPRKTLSRFFQTKDQGPGVLEA